MRNNNNVNRSSCLSRTADSNPIRVNGFCFTRRAHLVADTKINEQLIFDFVIQARVVSLYKYIKNARTCMSHALVTEVR